MGASGSSSSNQASNEKSRNINSGSLPKEDPSLLSLVSSSDPVACVPTNAGDTGSGSSAGGSNGGLLTLWKPDEYSGKITVVQGEIDQDQGVYISARASFNILSDKNKKKRRCCPRRKKRYKNDGRMTHSEDFDMPVQVITLHSANDVVIIPSEIYPLDMVSTLSLTPSDVKAKPVKKRRKTVPEKPDNPMSLWGLIKNAIGKDLTRFPLPVNFGEPLSMLQRLCEDYEYSVILDRASRMSDTLEQMASVAAFTVSSYASCAVRTAKPFNPLLGETFEFDRTDDMGWRCIGEQVCHHPPIATLHCDSALGWVQWQQFTMKSNYRPIYLELIPLGIAHLRFKNCGNHYTWRKVSTVVRNLLVGKLYIEQDGEMDIINHTTNERCHMKYSSGGIWSRDRSVTGRVYNSRNEPKWELNGAWDTEIRATKLDGNGKPIQSETRVLWQNTPLPSDADKRYYFSVFACQLNELEEGVAPTDSRNRPDQRYMENGMWDEANAEKQRLEDKQREARKQRLIDGATKHSTSSRLNSKAGAISRDPSGPEDGVEPYYTPSWFSRQRDPISGQLIYMFNGDYWDCKEKQDWKRCPKIFDK